MDNSVYAKSLPGDVRALIRAGKITTQTSGMCDGYAQANLCILPKEYAYDFLLFAQRNAAACPLLEVTDVGSRALRYIASDADIARDFLKYRVYRYGELVAEPTDISDLWQDDFVGFCLICCSAERAAQLEQRLPPEKTVATAVKPRLQIGDLIRKGLFAGGRFRLLRRGCAEGIACTPVDALRGFSRRLRGEEFAVEHRAAADKEQ